MLPKIAAVILVLACGKTYAAQPYRFDDYPVGKIHQGKRHKPIITLKWRKQQIPIMDGYADKGGQIDFAGHYTTVVWGCGTGCAAGVMTDARDGTIHNLLPVSSSDEMLPCFLPDGREDEAGLFQYRANSRLFTVYTCRFKPDADEKKYIQWRTDYFYEWREQQKKFVLLKKTVKKSVVPAS